ncbi:heterokaryon incompatibility protein-domain-containing protein [Dendryphion nanum]|uniref:Heterokaryon incompatibility protein-domain-containing protein n=1 Tax=Dendryphion nanum TaxID=256645 RepID=A0A9P9D351_9PLEO|nr:heterokaryon incompatibility protein-domain-containing protein [Dendryphion nanum]
MRLLDSKTLRFKVFEDGTVPRYAALSHTWGDDEILLQEMEKDVVRNNQGYRKVFQTAAQAAKDNIPYIWVDTCCIDKTSSAELSEAINSMYTWYRNAEVCYAYLSDVFYTASNTQGFSTLQGFKESRWFTRGWTLQELLAPGRLLFFDRDWQTVGSKADLEEKVSRITGIHIAALRGEDLRTFTVAQRMCWASKRVTTRVEDLAYCLLGIFDVNMPLLYGEGQKSFTRLQEAIMANTEDQTLFAWKDLDLPPGFTTGLLARSPACFMESGIFSFPEIWGRGVASEVTNKGIYTNLFLIPSDEIGIVRACLGCTIDAFSNDGPAIYLRRTSSLRTTMEKQDEYTRVRVDRLDMLTGAEKAGGTREEVYVKKLDELRLNRVREYRNVKVFWINIGSCRVYPERQWNPQSQIFWSPDTVDGKMGAVHLSVSDLPLFDYIRHFFLGAALVSYRPDYLGRLI